MTEIRSPQNPQLKSVKRLQSKRERARSGMFIAEGEDLVAAAEEAGWPAKEGYRVAGSDLGGQGFTDVQEKALAAVTTLGSGTRVIGVYEQRWAEHRAYLAQIDTWNRSQRHRARLGHKLRGALEFLQFLGF